MSLAGRRALRASRRHVMRLSGRHYETRSPQCLPADDASDKLSTRNTANGLSAGECTHWALTGLGLKAGWYMLEIEHSLASIGCVLTLEGANTHLEHLLLTSKAVCKRIVRLDARTELLTVSINQPGCLLKRLTMVAMSQRFAMNRMQMRLENRGSELLNSNSAVLNLYAAYRRQIDDSIFPGTYHPVPWAQNSKLQCASEPEPLPRNTLLVLHAEGICKNAPADVSVESAIAYARSVGWNIVWGSKPLFSATNVENAPGKRVFHMLVCSNVVYRTDVFHQLMSCIDEHSVLIYADHDHVDSQGRFFDPILKPAWNPELLLNADYIQLPWMISDAWVQQLRDQSMTTSIETQQLLLVASLGMDNAESELCHKVANSDAERVRDTHQSNKLVEPVRINPLTNEQVQRVPMVLASVKVDELYATDDHDREANAWHGNVSVALSNAGKPANVVSKNTDRICRVAWALPTPLPLVDIIIPTRDNVNVLKACIDSVLEKTRYTNYRLVVVDNDSKESETHAYYDELQADSRVRLLRYAGDFNFSAINNYAVEQSEATIVVLLNNDTEVISPGWLDELAGQAMRDEIGCVGAKLYYSNGRIQHGGVIVGITGVAGHAHRYCTGDFRGYCDRLVSTQNLVAVTAACLAVRRSTFSHAGGLDQQNLGVAWNDVDLCLKVQQLGFRNLWTPYAELFHHEGLSRGADDTAAKMTRVDAERRVMIDRWKLDRFNDPAYHPLLTRESEQFSLGRAITQPL